VRALAASLGGTLLRRAALLLTFLLVAIGLAALLTGWPPALRVAAVGLLGLLAYLGVLAVTAPAATRAAVLRALDRSRTSRASSSPSLSAPARSAWRWSLPARA